MKDVFFDKKMNKIIVAIFLLCLTPTYIRAQHMFVAGKDTITLDYVKVQQLKYGKINLANHKDSLFNSLGQPDSVGLPAGFALEDVLNYENFNPQQPPNHKEIIPRAYLYYDSIPLITLENGYGYLSSISNELLESGIYLMHPNIKLDAYTKLNELKDIFPNSYENRKNYKAGVSTLVGDYDWSKVDRVSLVSKGPLPNTPEETWRVEIYFVDSLLHSIQTTRINSFYRKVEP